MASPVKQRGTKKVSASCADSAAAAFRRAGNKASSRLHPVQSQKPQCRHHGRIKELKKPKLKFRASSIVVEFMQHAGLKNRRRHPLGRCCGVPEVMRCSKRMPLP